MNLKSILGEDPQGENGSKPNKKRRVKTKKVSPNALGEMGVSTESIMGEPVSVNLDTLNSETTKHVAVRKAPEGFREYSISIQGGIGCIEDYWDVINALHIAQPEDKVNMTIVSPGGSLLTATMICSAMEQCKARITATAAGMCASAGSFIWSCADECLVTWNAFVMFHMSSSLEYGKTTYNLSKSKHLIEFVDKIIRDYAVSKGIITEEEHNKIVNENGTVWILGDEMRKRLGGNDG